MTPTDLATTAQDVRFAALLALLLLATTLTFATTAQASCPDAPTYLEDWPTEDDLGCKEDL